MDNFFNFDVTGRNDYGGAAATDVSEDSSSAAAEAAEERRNSYPSDPIDALTGKQADRDYNSAESEKSREFDWQKMLFEQAYNSAEAQKSRDWNEYMSNTQIRRAFADAEAAGINPYYLLSGSTAGASYSGGSSASSQASTGSARASASGSNNSASAIASIFSAVILGIAKILA